jgi:hypothetical protein
MKLRQDKISKLLGPVDVKPNARDAVSNTVGFTVSADEEPKKRIVADIDLHMPPAHH